MNLLLDTHAFLWFINGSDRLSYQARDAIEAVSNQCYLSIASLWEISIKISLKRLQIGMSLTDLMERQVIGNDIRILRIYAHHLEQLSQLAFYHKDPFDRLIISQALAEEFDIVTKDELFPQYSVNLLW